MTSALIYTLDRTSVVVPVEGTEVVDDEPK